jgi:hypothetical protein
MKETMLSHYRVAALILAAIMFMPAGLQAQHRSEIPFPDVPGYVTLKCDFHMHTVFSDGEVWPTIRVAEAWQEGLDAIALSDHVEYQPHKDDVSPDLNRPFAIARRHAAALGLILIRGAEITRDMPPGHLNAIFLEDANLLKKEDFLEAVRAAVDQGAFIFWNHPSWTGQQPDGVARWYDIHTTLLEKKWLHGIEAVNSVAYCPQSHQWCLEKNLTLISNSDTHSPIAMEYDPLAGEHRPLTLVFATARTAEAIREALFAGRTVMYYRDLLIGGTSWLTALFDAGVEVLTPAVEVRERGSVYVQIRNRMAVDLELTGDGAVEGLRLAGALTLAAGKVTVLRVRSAGEPAPGTRKVELPFRVTNLRPAPGETLPVRIPLTVSFAATEK